MLITLTGQNNFARQTELDKLVSEFVVENGDISLERLDGEEADYQRIYDAVTSLPFLASKKMVVLKSPGANQEFIEKAENLLKNLPDSTDLLLVEPKFDKRSSFYKFLKKASDFREFEELDANGMARWLSEQAKAKKGNLSPTDARILVERVGLNQQMLASELNKLLLYNPQISRENIELLTEPAPQSTIFELLEAAFNGNSKKALKIYEEQRALKVEPLQIIAMLAWQLNILAFIKTGTAKSPEQVAKEAKLNPYVVRKSGSIAKRLSFPQLKNLVREALELDVRLKSEKVDADEALQLYILKLADI